MERENIDMHIHTNHSDGISTVENLLKQAEKLGLAIISITDHNTVSAYDEIQDMKKRSLFSGKIIPGVEITTTYNGEVIEVLGYGFDIQKMKELLSKNVYTFYEKQIAESKLNLETFKKYGVVLRPGFENTMVKSPEELFDPNKTSSRQAFFDEMRRHPENVRFFDSEDQMRNSTIRDFTRMFVYNPKSELYVDQSSLYPSLEKTIDMIHQAGGISFLAHIYEYSPTIASSLEEITQSYDLDGIECYYTTFTNEQSRYLERYCNKHGLFESCGSDFHGYEVKPNNHMGLATEGSKMKKTIILPWIDEINNILNPISVRRRFVESLKPCKYSENKKERS